MVSFDHYAHELRAQLVRATERGDTRVVIDAGNLHHSLSNRYELSAECWGAMEAAMGEGDKIEMMGLSICYQLPRSP
jgi:hypothetical protein